MTMGRLKLIKSTACVALLLAVQVGLLQATNYTAVEGDNTSVNCNVTGQAVESVWWTKTDPGSSFYQSGADLRFDPINRKDAGTYTCNAQVNTTAIDDEEVENVTLSQATIDVQYPATVGSVNISSSNVTEGQTFTIWCNVIGNPIPQYTIVNNDTGHVYLAGNKSLTLSMTSDPVGCLDSGTFVCTAKNEYNMAAATKSVALQVLCAPRLDPRVSVKHSIYSRLRADTAVQVYAVGNPRPSFDWSFKGKLLPKDRQVNLPHSSLLLFNNVSIPAYGIYTLNMSNSVGTFSDNFNLTPSGPPEMPTNFKAHNVTSTSVTLTWTSGYDYGAVQSFDIWNFVGQSVTILAKFPGSTDNFGIGDVRQEITGLHGDTNYTFSINAINSQGIGAVSPWMLHFRTEPGGNTSPSSASHTGAIVGGVVGGVALIAVVVGLLIYRRKRKNYITLDSL